VKILVDSCLSHLMADELRRAGYDVEWTGVSDPGDPAILARAYAENRVLITLDKDFGELAVLRRHPHAGIVRLIDILPSLHAAMCLRTLQRYGGALEIGAIVTVEVDRTRVRIEDDEDEDD
jgi:predicted nuclease of predicted toxin-antitoxin system